MTLSWFYWTLFIYLVGWRASLLIRKPVGINREAEAGPLDAVLRLRFVELVTAPPLLLFLPLLPLLPPVASLFGAFRAELRCPWGGLGVRASSPTVFTALCGCCRGNLPANPNTNTVVIATQRLSQRLWQTEAEESSLAAERSSKNSNSQTRLRYLLKIDFCLFPVKPFWIYNIYQEKQQTVWMLRCLVYSLFEMKHIVCFIGYTVIGIGMSCKCVCATLQCKTHNYF